METTERHEFVNKWDEIRHLYDKLLYWLYRREDQKKARPYARRLELLLGKVNPEHKAIFGEECWSLVHEANGDFQRAIQHRQNEIRLIRRLRAISSNQPYKEVILKDYDVADLSDRLNLLATLYHGNGDLEKAIKVLEASRQFCARHGIRFDGADVLQEYLAKKNASRKDSRYILAVEISENGEYSVRRLQNPSAITERYDGAFARFSAKSTSKGPVLDRPIGEPAINYESAISTAAREPSMLPPQVESGIPLLSREPKVPLLPAH